MPTPTPETVEVHPARGKVARTAQLLLAAAQSPGEVSFHNPHFVVPRTVAEDAGFLASGSDALTVRADPDDAPNVFPDLVPALPAAQVAGAGAEDTGYASLKGGTPLAEVATSSLPGADSADPTKSASESNPGVEAYGDLLGDDTAELVKEMTVAEIEDALESGELSKDEVRKAELAGKNRKGVLALADEE